MRYKIDNENFRLLSPNQAQTFTAVLLASDCATLQYCLLTKLYLFHSLSTNILPLLSSAKKKARQATFPLLSPVRSEKQWQPWFRHMSFLSSDVIDGVGIHLISEINLLLTFGNKEIIPLSIWERESSSFICYSSQLRISNLFHTCLLSLSFLFHPPTLTQLRPVLSLQRNK